MNSVTKNKSLVSIIIFLLITNIAMLVFFLVLNKPPQKDSHSGNQNGMSGMLQREVGFSKDQIDTYQSLRKDQMDTIHVLFEELRKSKMSFYDLIYSSQVADSSVNKAADIIAERQKVLDLYMFNHFKKVRNICTPDQLQKFDTTLKKVLIRMINKNGRDDHNQHK